ncbi:beta-CASP domain-containing protein [Ordospora colligata]|uniref:Cleavage and polyadenylation specificity factor subunit 2 n=1 Tax=Ordospora colligata OC4 TaxID=1354746 RepID=A0A0B2UMG1_9MICR|nr:beta-CASP domain-containing protein [Ordospora colligata OC4]KHN70563.1 beta-CASP domain-containing protein [Ordospora colligata OC4]TBU17313.1 beta-CASP domain-containing protein [Ordospora colligata]TBU17563.1 beta-CASP domain-containing protein [Ordospora colligata]TBU19743.1 beta-CASP domain-containing protein [Ordospora colligata]
MSSSFVSLTPLIRTDLGVYCHLLEIDNTKILINCGAPKTMEMAIYESLMPRILACDVILLTSFGINCIGGLPHILHNNYYNKVISSVPIKVLGKICMEEHVRGMEPPLDIDVECFDRISEIKYLQPTIINGVEICAYNSGNSIGGCLYKISKGAEKIVIGFNVNHRKENHLDGMNISVIGDCGLCVFTGNHVLAENVSVVKRDDVFVRTIMNAVENKRRVIIPVRYSRLLEICLVLNEMANQKGCKVVCLSYLGNKFIERAKSMVEWAGEKVSSMFSEEKVNPFEFEGIRFVKHYVDLCEFDVLIVVDEWVSGCMFTSVLHCFNDKNNVIMVTDPRLKQMLRDECTEAKLYNFRLQQKVKEDLEDNNEEMEVEEQIDEEPEEVGVESHWSETKHEVWCESGQECFPSLSRRRAYDDYGEYVDKSMFVKDVAAVEEVQEIFVEEESLNEEREEVCRGLELKYDVACVEMMGVSDLGSCKMVLESLSPRKLVCVGEDSDTERFFYHTFKYMMCFEDVYLCRDKLVLSSNVLMGMVKLSDGFESVKYQKIGTDFVAGFRGIKNGDMIECIGEGPSMMLGHLEMNEMRRMIVERKMRVEQDDEGLVVEGCVWIRMSNSSLMIDGKDASVFYAVRDVIYNNLAFI